MKEGKHKSKKPKQTRQLRHDENRKRQRFIQAGIVALVLLLAAGYFLWPRPQALAVSPDRLNDDPFLGADDAQVTIIEYGDFGCPSCRAWHNAGILDQILATYGDQVRFVWRDFPVITAFSPEAAQAAQCAYDQGHFWEYHDLLFERAASLRVGDLKSYANELGLDRASFDRCLDSEQHRATVEKDLEEAFERRLPGTPSFLINEQPLAGPPNFQTLQSLIEANLNQ
ncbi:MAG: thioredoxin domain-containing protein [Anaerolineales bacterium]